MNPELLKVLLVDDEEDYLDILYERLSLRGFLVETASLPHQALELLQKGGYRAVVLDMMMPGLSGMEALKRIRARHPEIRVILQTGHATPETEAKARSLGAAGLFQKPADLDRLARLIRGEEA